MHHKAMFTAGAILSGMGLLAIGAAAGSAAEAAGWQTTAITYLAPWFPGDSRPCGFQVPGTADTTPKVREIKRYGGEDLRICQMIVRVPK